MRRSGRILFILGFVLAIISALALYFLIAESKPPPAEVPTTKVVVAFQNVPQRSEVSADQVGLVDWPQTVPTPIGAYDSPSSVLGKLAKAPIYPGQPVNSDMLVDKTDLKESHSNAALIIDDRMRAIAMPVKVDTNVAEAIQAGDRVDFVVTFTAQPVNAQGQPEGTSTTKTHRLLEDVLVLQVGPWPNPGVKAGDAAAEQQYSVVTLQVNLQDAQVIKYAQLKADDVSLALRRANDHTLEVSEPVTLEYLNKRFGYNWPVLGQ